MRSYIYIWLLSVIALMGCSRQTTYPEAMKQAESCMDAHPDSAFHLLSAYEDSINTLPEEAQMFYHLLTIQAKDKLYITHTDDSLINRIVQFYEEENRPERLMLAYYYQGSVYRDMNDAPRALKAFQQVADMNRNCPPSDLMARTYNQMGTLFAYQGLYNESLEANRQAARQFLLQGKKNRTSYAYRDMARMFDMKEQKDSALFYYHKAHSMAVEAVDSHRIYGILGEMAGFYERELNKEDTAKIMLLQVLQNRKVRNNNVYQSLGRIYEKEKQWDSVYYYWEKSLNTHNLNQQYYAHAGLFSLEIEKQNYPQAISHIKTALILNDSIKKITKTEAVAKINSLYNYQHINKELEKEQQANLKRKFTNYILSSVLLVLFILMGWLIAYIKQRKALAFQREKQLLLLKEELYIRSTEALENNQRKIHSLEEELCQLKSDKKQLIKELTQQKELLEISSQKIMTVQAERELKENILKGSEIYQLFHKACHVQPNIKITEKEWQELQIAIDDTYPNFSKTLYSLCPQLSLMDLRICYAIKISLSVTDIANLVNRSKSAITASRIRLYKKLHGVEGSAEMFDRFIADL